MSIEINPTKIATKILLRLGFFLGLSWLVQAMSGNGRVPSRFVVWIVVSMTSLSLLVDLFLPQSADQDARWTHFDHKRLRQAIYMAIGVATGSVIGGYYRHHDAYSFAGWAVNIALCLAGGFTGGYGPVRLTRALAASWREKAASSSSPAPKGAA